MGADLVMHSCTKFMGGHSDLILGALSTNNESLGLSLRKVQKYRGATPSSFDCYLLHRSLMTLEVNHVRIQCYFLSQCSEIEK